MRGSLADINSLSQEEDDTVFDAFTHLVSPTSTRMASFLSLPNPLRRVRRTLFSSAPPTPETPKFSTPTKGGTPPPLRPPIDLWEPEEGKRTYVAAVEPRFKVEEKMGEYIFLAESGKVREDFVAIGPQEVDEAEKAEDLHRLAANLVPDNFLTNEEVAYLDLLNTCIAQKLTDLAL